MLDPSLNRLNDEYIVRFRLSLSTFPYHCDSPCSKKRNEKRTKDLFGLLSELPECAFVCLLQIGRSSWIEQHTAKYRETNLMHVWPDEEATLTHTHGLTNIPINWPINLSALQSNQGLVTPNSTANLIKTCCRHRAEQISIRSKIANQINGIEMPDICDTLQIICRRTSMHDHSIRRVDHSTTGVEPLIPTAN